MRNLVFALQHSRVALKQHLLAIGEFRLAQQRQAEQSWTSFNTRSLIGGALLGQKDYANAEPLLLQGFVGLKDRETQIPSEGKILLTQALKRIVQLYEDWGQPEKAAEWREKLDSQK